MWWKCEHKYLRRIKYNTNASRSKSYKKLKEEEGRGGGREEGERGGGRGGRERGGERGGGGREGEGGGRGGGERRGTKRDTLTNER